jgi:hypothetical protein
VSVLEQQVPHVYNRLCAIVDLLRELVDVESGSGGTVPKLWRLSAADPFRTFKVEEAEGDFHAIRVDNFSNVELDIVFDGRGPNQQNADERIPPMTGRIIARPYSVASVGFDPLVAPAAATSVRVTFYSRQLQPATYSLDTRERESSFSTVTKEALTGVEQVLLAANGARRGGAIYNDSAATLYVKLGDNATADDWTVKLNAGDYYELPAGYAGIVTGISSAAAGQCRATELT